MVRSNSLKPSNYNILVEDKIGYYILTNTLSGALMRIDNSTFKIVNKILNSSFINPELDNKKLISILLDNRFIIPESFNEISFLKTLHEEARTGEKALGVGITPTLNCNFDCVYFSKKIT